jgi:hypothetical protein
MERRVTVIGAVNMIELAIANGTVRIAEKKAIVANIKSSDRKIWSGML